MIGHYDLRQKIEIFFVAFLIFIAVAYGGWKAYPLLAGPHITVYSPTDDAVVASTTFEISGKVTRVKEITLQGRPIPIDTDGHFNEILVAQAPYTIIVLTATDFYGSTVTKTFRVIPRN